MADEQMITVTIMKWVTGAILSIGIWVGSIEQRLRHKAEKADIAKDPVEADTITIALDDVNASLKSVRIAQDRNNTEIIKLGKGVATLMERTK